MKKTSKKFLAFITLVVIVIGMTSCSSKNNSEKVVDYTEQEVRSIQKSPETLIKAYYEECIPIFQSANPSKENLSRIYSLEKLTVYKYNKTAEVQATQTSNNVKKTIEKVGKLLDYKIGEFKTNKDGSVKVTVVEQYEKSDVKSSFLFLQKDDLWEFYYTGAF